MDLSLFLIYACAISVTSVLVSVLRRMKSWQSLSSKQFPGPAQFPLIGRVHDLPMTSTWLKFKEWADQYGPIYETSMMGQKFIVISDEDMATDLMVKKGNSFSGRAQIRALIDHKKGPTYVALQDRNGTHSHISERKQANKCRDVEDAAEMGTRGHGCLFAESLQWTHRP